MVIITYFKVFLKLKILFFQTACLGSPENLDLFSLNGIESLPKLQRQMKYISDQERKGKNEGKGEKEKRKRFQVIITVWMYNRSSWFVYGIWSPGYLARKLTAARWLW